MVKDSKLCPKISRLIELPVSPLKLLLLNFFVISLGSTIKSIFFN